jgi:putative oxidoreductase
MITIGANKYSTIRKSSSTQEHNTIRVYSWPLKHNIFKKQLTEHNNEVVSLGMLDKFEKYAHCHDLPLRIALGIVFLFAGFGKLFGEPGLAGFQGMLSGLGFPVAGLFALLVAVIEFAGAIALFAGWYTRYVAALLTFILLVAIVLVKIPGNGGISSMFADIALLGASISLLFTGSKSYCMDKALSKKTPEPKIHG